MEKLVLVGIDPGYRDMSALQWALEWATATGQELLVVSGFEVGQSEVPPDYHDEMLSEARHLVDDKMRAAADGSRGVAVSAPTRSVIVEGHPTQVVVDAVHNENPSLVVVGSRGDGGYDQLAVGGVAHQVVSKLSRPVALVRHLGGPIVSGVIVVGFDGSDPAGQAIRWAIDSARSTGSRVVVLREVGVHELAAVDLAIEISRLADGEVPVEVVDRTEAGGAAPDGSDDHVAELCRLGDETDASMIVAGSTGAGRLLELIAGRDGARLLELADRPVVIIHQD